MSNIFKKILQFKICEKEINYAKLNPKNWRRPSFKKIIKGLAFLIIFLGALIIVKDEYEYQFGDYSYYFDNEISENSEAEYDCNVLGIEIRGDVVTYITPDSKDENGNNIFDETASEDVIYLINQADKDPDIKAIILEIDSFGGSAVAAEEINEAIKRTNKPVIAFIRTAAASAAYWVASGADTIFASALSDVGGIGITMSYLDKTKKNEKEGLTYNSLSTGKFKDYGDPNKPMTAEERSLIMRDLEIMHNLFIKAVSANRNLPIDKVRALADGSSMPGEMALENGLIDKIGGIYDVEDYLKEKLGENIEVCW